MSFEWQTTEEGSEEPWQQEPAQEATGSPFQRRRWLVLLLTLALAACGRNACLIEYDLMMTLAGRYA